MYQPLPLIAEDLETLQERLRHERDPKRTPRLHLLVLIKSGQVTSRGQAAVHLALHRNTVAVWLRRYRDGGLETLLAYKEPGAPAGQKTLPPAVFEQLKARLATPTGFASYLDVQRWLREAFALEVPYKTLHGIVHYQLKAKLKRPRPSHAKKMSLRPRTLSNSVHAAWAPLPPEGAKPLTNRCGSAARMKVASVCTCPSIVG
jgi:transposase